MHRQEEEVLFCHSNNCTTHNNLLIFLQLKPETCMRNGEDIASDYKHHWALDEWEARNAGRNLCSSSEGLPKRHCACSDNEHYSSCTSKNWEQLASQCCACWLCWLLLQPGAVRLHCSISLLAAFQEQFAAGLFMSAGCNLVPTLWGYLLCGQSTSNIIAKLQLQAVALWGVRKGRW